MSELTEGERVFVKYPEDTQGAHGYIIPPDAIHAHDAAKYIMVEFQPEMPGRQIAIRMVALREYVTPSPDLCPESFTCSVCRRERRRALCDFESGHKKGHHPPCTHHLHSGHMFFAACPRHYKEYGDAFPRVTKLP